MGQIKFIKIIDDKLMPGGSLTILKPGIPAKPVGNSRVRPKPEGALDKLHFLFGKEKWRNKKEFEYYQDLVRNEPGNTFARLRLAEIYQKRGEKKKAIWEYLQTAEIFSKKRFYPQAVAIYKRIQKQDPALFQLYPKFAEICRKMGFQEDTSSEAPQGMKESAQKGKRPLVDSKFQDMQEDKQEKKVQSFQEVGKAKEEKGENRTSTQTPEVSFPGAENKNVLFDLGEQLESGEPPEGKEKEVTTEKSYGFEEILRELKEADVPSKAYPDFHYNMGVACREMGFINEAIEQFRLALECGQKPFEAAHLLGLCFLDRGKPIEARQSFEKALKQEGTSKEKLREVELALIGMSQKGEKGTAEFLKVNKVRGEQPEESFRYQNKKTDFAKLGSSLIFPRPPSTIRKANP